MALFKYKAITERGDVIRHIKETDLEEETDRKVEINLFKHRISNRDISIFCRQFSTMMKAGVSLVNSLDLLIKQTENKALKRAILTTYEDVHKGFTLSTSMKKHNRVFPEFLISMIQVGEITGNFAANMLGRT